MAGILEPDESSKRETSAGTKYEVVKWTCPKCAQQRSTLYIDNEWCHGESYAISWVDGVRSERCGTCWREEIYSPEPKNHSSPSSAKHRSAASRGNRFISPGAHEGYAP